MDETSTRLVGPGNKAARVQALHEGNIHRGSLGEASWQPAQKKTGRADVSRWLCLSKGSSGGRIRTSDLRVMSEISLATLTRLVTRRYGNPKELRPWADAPHDTPATRVFPRGDVHLMYTPVTKLRRLSGGSETFVTEGILPLFFGSSD